MTSSIGYTTLKIIPTLEGISEAVQKQIAVLPNMGKAAGKLLGEGLSSGVDDAAKKVETATTKMAAANKKVEDSAGKVRVAQAQYQALLDKGVTDAGRLAAAEEKVAAAHRNHDQAAATAKTTTAALTTAEEKLAQASKRAEDGQKGAASAAGNAAGKQGLVQRAAESAGKAFEGLAGKAKTAGSTILTGIGFGAGANIVGISKSLIEMGDTFAQVNKKVAFATGATGKELDSLNASVRTIGKDSPKALTDIADTMGTVARATQLTGKPLEEITKRMVKLDALGQTANIGGLTQSLRAFGVPADQMAGKMDDLFKVSRATGIGMDDLAATLQKGAPQLKQFGLGVDESASMIGGLQKAGIDSDRAMMGLNTALKVVSKQGGDVKQNFSNAVGEIKRMSDAGDQAGATAAASKLFGGKAFGPMLEAIKQGRLDMNQLNQSIGAQQSGILKAGGAVVTMSGAWQMLKNNVLILLEPVVKKIFEVIQKGIMWFRGEGVEGIRRFGDKLQSIWNNDGVQKFIHSVQGIVENAVWPNIIAKITLVVDVFKSIASVVGPVLVGALETLGSVIMKVTGFLAEHTTALKVIGTAISVILIPSMITASVQYATLGVAAVVSGAKQVGAWVAAKVEAATSAAAQVAASYKQVGAWVLMGTTATKNAVVIGSSWVAAGAGATGAAAKTAAYAIAQGAVKIATTSWAAAQWLLNAAMSANPIGLVVLAIAALVAGFVLAWKHSETFRNIVTGAWNMVKQAASAAVNWFTNTAWPFLQRVWDGIKDGIGKLVNWATEAWDRFTAPARAAASWFTDTLVAWLSKTWNDITAGFRTIVAAAQEVWDMVKQKFTNMVDFVASLPGKISDRAKGMWDGIGNAFKSVVNSMIRTWNWFASKLSFKTPDWVPGLGGKEFSVPTIAEFAQGGHTGPGSKYQIAGIVHADEFVLSKRARGMLEATAPGGLDFMNRTGQWPGYAEGGQVQTAEGLNPGADFLRTMIMKKWPQITTIGGRRAEDGYGEHSSGNAIDVMIPNYASPEGNALGGEVLAYLQQNSGPLQLDGVIWHQASYGYGGPLTSAQTMSDRGSDTQNHMDHLHVILGKGRGANAAPVGVPVGMADAAPPAVASSPSTDPSMWSPISAAVATTEPAGVYSGLTGKALKTKYDEDTDRAKADYDAAVADLKVKYGIGSTSAELSDRSRDIGKRRRDLSAQYRSDTAEAKGDKDKLAQLRTDYQAASDKLKDESDRLADDRDASAVKKTADKSGYDTAKDELDRKYKQDTDARKKAYEQAKDDDTSKDSDTGKDSGNASDAEASGAAKSYPTSFSGWAGFIGENFVGGQIKSLLSVFGIPDSPAWMQGISQLIGGIKVTDKAGKSVFDGSNPMAALTGQADTNADSKDKSSTRSESDTAPAATELPTPTTEHQPTPGGPIPLPTAAAPPAPAPIAPAPPAAPAAVTAPPADYSGGTPAVHDAVFAAFKHAGYTDDMWPAFVQLENREAGWDPEARNNGSGAYGLAQFLGQDNADKYLGGSTSNVPVDVQATGMMSYIKDRYGDPNKAWDFWQKNNWYSGGGHTGPGSKYQIAGIVHADEFVLSKRARGMLEATAPGGLDFMNRTGQWPGYATGGRVGLPTQDLWTGAAQAGMTVATSMIAGQTGKTLPGGGQVIYNMAARDTEDLFIRAQRQERERAAAKLSRF